MKILTPKAKKLLARLSDAKKRARIADEFNRDNAGPVGGDQGIKLLKEMNALEDEHEKYLDSLRESRLGH